MVRSWANLYKKRNNDSNIFQQNLIKSRSYHMILVFYIKHWKILLVTLDLTHSVMNKLRYLLLILPVMLLFSCNSSKNTVANSSTDETSLQEKNRANIELLTRIRRLPGVILKNGKPAINKNSNTVAPYGSGEPLYVLNGQIIGNSFQSIDELVHSYNVKSVKVLSDSDAAFYGSQAASGVIAVTTY